MREAMCPTMFDDIAGSYDRLVDWPKRLAREGPFFRDLFARHGVKRVLDAGCGTGHHAAMFHSWGLNVVASDISEAMLDQCARLHGRDERLKWVRRSLTEPPDAGEPFDAVVCLGNSLGLAGDLDAVRGAVRTMLNSLRPGGIGVLQVLNVLAIPEGPTQWQKAVRFSEGGNPVVLLKGIHRLGLRGYVDLVELKIPPSGVDWGARSMSFLGLGRAELCSMIRDCGGDVQDVFGSYEGDAFAEGRSGDLIVAWRRMGRGSEGSFSVTGTVCDQGSRSQALQSEPRTRVEDPPRLGPRVYPLWRVVGRGRVEWHGNRIERRLDGIHTRRALACPVRMGKLIRNETNQNPYAFSALTSGVGRRN